MDDSRLDEASRAHASERGEAEAAEAFFDLLAERVASLRSAPDALAMGLSGDSQPSSGLPPGTAVGRYRIVERIGAGGMGTVYRAHDPELEREVALKVLPPHLSVDPAARERFLVEARAAASLDHPDICTIHEIGQTEDGRPFLAMALYRGETLKERLARGPLPVAEAVEIAVRIARGLAAAHARGIVHRDVKPGNVMLTEDGAVKLLDFGLAKVVDDVSLTRPGSTPGTVAYMSPEQVRGQPVDRRSDLWSLGVVLYEMLAGVRPFQGERDRAVLHSVLHEEPRPLTELRPESPAWIGTVVERLLRKDPEARYADVQELLAGLGVDEPRRARPRSSRRAAFLSLAAAGLAALAALGVWLGGSRSPETVDPGRVAVLPFRVAGADPSLGYLREGMVDLLTLKLSGGDGPPTVDPRTVTVAWGRATDGKADLTREEALALGRELGAARVVLGEVMSLPGRVVLAASLHDRTSAGPGIPMSVEGPLDSLPTLVDRLAVGLLGADAGEERRLTSLMTTSPAALRLYLEGQTAYRNGRYVEAVSYFSRAVEHDSTFALAALRAWGAATRVRMTPPVGYLHAWRHRDRLGDRDRAFLEALVGPNHPGHSSHLELEASRAALVREQPDDARAWHSWANSIPGAALAKGNVDSVLRRAKDAFERAYALDSGNLSTVEHLAFTSRVLGDTAEARRYESLLLEKSSTGIAAETIRCRRAVETGGVGALPAILARLDSVGADVANRCLQDVHLLLPGAADAASPMARHLRERIDDPAVLVSAWWALYVMGRDQGRPSEVESLFEAMERADLGEPLVRLRRRVGDALYWDGDEQAAARAAGVLESMLERIPADSISDPVVDAICVLGQWRLALRENPEVGPLIERLRDLGRSGYSWDEVSAHHCATMLETWRAARSGAPDLEQRIARLDSSLIHGPIAGPRLRETSLLLARLLEERGDAEGALQMLRRSRLAFPHVYRSTYLLEQGRLAALAGDTAAAVDAYRRYLAMRSDPEPSLRSDVERVREELARLTGGLPP